MISSSLIQAIGPDCSFASDGPQGAGYIAVPQSSSNITGPVNASKMLTLPVPAENPFQ